MEIKGKVTHILEQVNGESAKGPWTKQTFVILEDTAQYPKSIAIDVFNEKVNIPPVGTMVNASINISSNESKGRWFTNIGVWKMDIISSGQGDLTAGQINAGVEIPQPTYEEDDSNSLPF